MEEQKNSPKSKKAEKRNISCLLEKSSVFLEKTIEERRRIKVEYKSFSGAIVVFLGFIEPFLQTEKENGERLEEEEDKKNIENLETYYEFYKNGIGEFNEVRFINRLFSNSTKKIDLLIAEDPAFLDSKIIEGVSLLKVWINLLVFIKNRINEGKNVEDFTSLRETFWRYLDVLYVSSYDLVSNYKRIEDDTLKDKIKQLRSLIMEKKIHVPANPFVGVNMSNDINVNDLSDAPFANFSFEKGAEDEDSSSIFSKIFSTDVLSGLVGSDPEKLDSTLKKLGISKFLDMENMSSKFKEVSEEETENMVDKILSGIGAKDKVIKVHVMSIILKIREGKIKSILDIIKYSEEITKAIPKLSEQKATKLKKTLTNIVEKCMCLILGSDSKEEDDKGKDILKKLQSGEITPEQIINGNGKGIKLASILKGIKNMGLKG